MPRPTNEPDTTTYVGRVAAEIRRRRIRRKLSGEEAAEQAGVNVQTWYNWERARNPPPLAALPSIARALGCRPRLLLPDE